ncbi:MAG: hypothetical protein ACJA2O_004602 [Candidatus Azotimanducaceae bacterium]|jgi:hypothetical protein
MTDKTEILNTDTLATRQSDSKQQLLRSVGWLGVIIAAPFFLWVPLGFTGLIPSMIDVFGVVGLRIPAGVTIAGLLLSAIGFHQI